MTATISPDVQDYLRRLSRRRRITFDTMAQLAAAQFGADAAPTAGAIAAFLGGELRGKSSLNRLARDTEVAEWLRQNSASSTIDGLRAACARTFGANRTPSRSALSVFLRAAGRRGRYSNSHILKRDAEVVAWLRKADPSRSLSALVEGCAARFGVERTPSRSAIGRLLKPLNGPRRRRPLRVATDAEIAVWVRENAPRMTLDQLRAGCMARFGADRAPSRMGIHRFLSRLPGARLTRRKGRLDRDPEVAAWLLDNRGLRTLDGLHEAVVERFGEARAPSRSAIHRYLSAVAQGRVPTR